MVDILRLSPVISAYPDDESENLEIEVILPGVEKKNITFKITRRFLCKSYQRRS
ncbi:hypothetical protein [Methanosarcina sp. Kolksee]|uniref:hypothetical protein n=1 Tax=Methanosarcina sp. Kolksee TaxID=1434099 RepID=UPI001E3F4044|nr:hypothetical protein [Methanosarcina sp. Kolksee]